MQFGKLAILTIVPVLFVIAIPSLAGAESRACPGCPPPIPLHGWHPTGALRHQFQLQGVPGQFCSTGGYNTDVSGLSFLGKTVAPKVYAIDLYADDGACPNYKRGTLNADAVNSLHAQGKRAIAYISIGAWESYRPDASKFKAFDRQCGGCLLGKGYFGSNDSRWLNLNNNHGQRDFLYRLMAARLLKAKNAGFDAVYYDITDGFNNDTGFHISARTQLLYNSTLLNMAHLAGLAAGLNYDILQVKELEPYEEFHIDESCWVFSECSYFDPVRRAHKPVFEIEYVSNPPDVCPAANKLSNFLTVFKSFDLYDVPWEPCR
ncbi:MAG TPA: endo alpha-1,4 polygalactosaminidase [Terriglobales bacterium]|nr:endo alpha-1,4 polygalactosaminidase [Terriglobales bacterium]